MLQFKNLGNNQYDFNSLTLLQVRDVSELCMSNLSILNAGDDGLEIFGGSHSIDNLTIKDSIEDNVDLDSNAILNIVKSLTLINGVFVVGDSAQGPGLIEVQGASGTTNRLHLTEGASFHLFGRFTDKTGLTTTTGGSFASFIPGTAVYEWGSALPNTFVQDISP